jgi:hypothetical protein
MEIRFPPQLEPISSLQYLEPNPYYLKTLLESLKEIKQGNKPGSIVSKDGKIRAERMTACTYKFIDNEIRVDEWLNTAIRVMWKDLRDNEWTFCFWADPWKGRIGLVRRLKKYLKQIN